MKFRIFIIYLSLLICGQKSTKGKEAISKNDTPKTAFDTIKTALITKEESQDHTTTPEDR